jgi:predicted phosphodiesterase
MKYAIVSDVHANLPAFKKVLEHLDAQDVNVKVNLGDIVGYGPFPNECVELTVKNFNYIVMGNHDIASVEKAEAFGFNSQAKEAIEWTRRHLDEANKDFLRNLEYGYITQENLMFVHGSPRSAFAYVNSDQEALLAFSSPVKKYDIAFVGHTHVPCIYIQHKDGTILYIRPEYGDDKLKVGHCSYQLEDGDRFVVNVGAVGQPRDSDERASYVTYDTETRELIFYRIPYPIDRTIGKMQQAAFSTDAWSRLLYGR